MTFADRLAKDAARLGKTHPFPLLSRESACLPGNILHQWEQEMEGWSPIERSKASFQKHTKEKAIWKPSQELSREVGDVFSSVSSLLGGLTKDKKGKPDTVSREKTVKAALDFAEASQWF
ncbi:hypothetical protein AFUB_063740 [Aspergillus fumigatus A1163]|nr:hypothetical protein AFUB_063740 [Aspergillus fumigatus A1163]